MRRRWLRIHIGARRGSAFPFVAAVAAFPFFLRLHEGLHGNFKIRQVAVKHWAGLGTPDAVRKAADLLADYGWLEREATPSGAAGGRPGERYVLHPVLVKGGTR